MSSKRRLAAAPAASGQRAKKLDHRLDALPSIMMSDPKGHQRELELHYKDFNSSLKLFKQQTALSSSSVDPAVAEHLGSLATFLSRVAPSYPKYLADFPAKLADLLRSAARFPSELRFHLAKALRNPQMADIEDTLEVFMELQSLGDRKLGDLASSHVIETITKMNQKHKDRVKNEKLQKILFQLLKKDEQIAKRSLITLCRLHKSKIWFDSRTAEAICSACFHDSPRVMTSALSLLLEYEKIQKDDDGDASSSEDEATKANRMKKKRIKLKRFDGGMKTQQHLSSKYYSPLNHLKDAQGFAEKLFSKLEACNERFGVKMMMMKVIAQLIGLHRLVLVNFYPYLLKYVQPDQYDITKIIATAIEACHDKIPPDSVEPLFKQIVNQFILDQSSTEDIDVGLNAIREICLRVPLLMTEELLQDLGLYNKSHQKAISAAAHSLIDLFREVCPSLMNKKGHGRPTNPEAKPKAYAEVTIASDVHVPDLELLQEDDVDSEADHDTSVSTGDDGETSLCSDEVEDELEEDKDTAEDSDDINSDAIEDELEDNDTAEDDDDDGINNGDRESNLCSDDTEDEQEEDNNTAEDDDGDGIDNDDINNTDKSDDNDDSGTPDKPGTRKRKASDFEGELNPADLSLRALKQLAAAKAQKLAELLKSAYFKIPISDELSAKPLDPSKLEVHVHKKPSKEERVPLVKKGREDTEKFQARTAMKQKKTGGLSNQQKKNKKLMPRSGKIGKVAKSGQDKKKQKQ